MDVTRPWKFTFSKVYTTRKVLFSEKKLCFSLLPPYFKTFLLLGMFWVNSVKKFSHHLSTKGQTRGEVKDEKEEAGKNSSFFSKSHKWKPSLSCQIILDKKAGSESEKLLSLEQKFMFCSHYWVSLKYTNDRSDTYWFCWNLILRNFLVHVILSTSL